MASKKKRNPLKVAFQRLIENLPRDIAKPLGSAIIAAFQKWSNFLGIAETENVFITPVLTFVLAYGAIQITMDIYDLLRGDQLLALARLRTEGVQLRNKGQKMGTDPKESQDWIAEFEDWNERVIKAISKISKADAEHWNILNRYNVRIKETGTNKQKVKWSVLDEKIDRLEKLYEEYRKAR